MSDVKMRCACGKVRGTAEGVAPDAVNHCYCYCHDCRAFVHWLEQDALLDAWGGAHYVQLARARFRIDEGRSELACLRLSPRGLHRFYAACCKTPIANAMPRVPFASLTVGTLELEGPESALLPEADVVHPGSALRGPPRGSSGRHTLRALARPGRLMAGWLARGLGQPTPLFDRSERASVEPRILTPAEREALRSRPDA